MIDVGYDTKITNQGLIRNGHRHQRLSPPKGKAHNLSQVKNFCRHYTTWGRERQLSSEKTQHRLHHFLVQTQDYILSGQRQYDFARA